MNDDDDKDQGAGARSGRYPGVSLKDALEAAEKLYKAERQAPVSNETAAGKMGYKGLSGPARVMIGSLRQYGLIDKVGVGQFRLSRLAIQALHGTAEQKAQAIKEAALKPPLFAELCKTHLDGSEENIKSYLITAKEFIDTGARNAAKAFRDTMKLANVSSSGYNAATASVEPEDNGMDMDRANQELNRGGGAKPDAPGVFSMTVPFAKGSITVQVRVTGDSLKPAHLARVRRYLELAEQDWDAESEDTE
jgi:hypothetical protein